MTSGPGSRPLSEFLTSAMVSPSWLADDDVAEQVVGVDEAEHRAPIVHQQDDGLGGGVPGHDAPHDRAQQIRLAGLALGESEEMRVVVEVEEHRREAVLVRRRSGSGAGRAAAAAPATARTAAVPAAGAPAARWPAPGGGDLADGVLHAGADDRPRWTRSRCAATRPGSAACPASGRDPGRPTGTLTAILAVELGLAGVTEPQLQAGAHEVLDRRPDLRPAVGRDRSRACRRTGPARPG